MASRLIPACSKMSQVCFATYSAGSPELSSCSLTRGLLSDSMPCSPSSCLAASTSCISSWHSCFRHCISGPFSLPYRDSCRWFLWCCGFCSWSKHTRTNGIKFLSLAISPCKSPNNSLSVSFASKFPLCISIKPLHLREAMSGVSLSYGL